MECEQSESEVAARAQKWRGHAHRWPLFVFVLPLLGTKLLLWGGQILYLFHLYSTFKALLKTSKNGQR